MATPLTERIWRKSTSAPSWAHKLVRAVWKRYGKGPIPKIAFNRCRTAAYYGRWFPSVNAIALCCLPGERKRERTVLLHELAHAILSYNGNFVGRHNRQFYELVMKLYSRYKADPTFVEQIELGMVKYKS